MKGKKGLLFISLTKKKSKYKIKQIEKKKKISKQL